MMADVIVPQASSGNSWWKSNNLEKCDKRYSDSMATIYQTSAVLRLLSSEILKRVAHTVAECVVLQTKYGVHSSTYMRAAGFCYTGNGDTARCEECKLEVSEWTEQMKPFQIHAQRSPNCSFVQSIIPKTRPNVLTTASFITLATTTNDGEQPAKKQRTEVTEQSNQPGVLVETDLMKQARKRTFSHWPHRTSPSGAQMIDAGFLNCNVGDRVICLYCNLICQQWTPNVDDPWEIHRTLSPNCPLVITMLKQRETVSIRIVNGEAARDNNGVAPTNDVFRSNEIVFTAACHPPYIEIPRRHASFETWPSENAPPVDDLVRAGFFYTGTKTIVTCFYCNGSLQNWGANDNPMIEHARWFPHCAYAKQLCGAELHRKIQESKRAQQERARANDPNRQNNGGTDVVPGRGQLNIPDESTLSRFVAARLDLAISQRMLDKHFKLSIIKRCWEDQLRLKRDDFADKCDLFLACLILLKQIEFIDGKKENIIVPSVAMDRRRERDARAREQPAAAQSSSESTSNTNEMETSTSSESSNVEEPATNTAGKKDEKADVAKASGGTQSNQTTPGNPCVLCLEEERRLACIPCGHLATCVPCGHSLRSCPICRTAIDAFVRIYL